MEDIERRIRESLQARAGDVEPTPMLWERVQQRVRKDRVWNWSLAAVAAAAAVLAAVVVVPGLLTDRQDLEIVDPMASPTATPTPTPTDAPTPQATDEPAPSPTTTADPDATVAPSHLVVTDGTSIDLVTRSGDVVRNLVTLASEGESSVTDLAVRPGSSSGDLTVVFAAEAEGMVDLRYVTVRDGEVSGPEHLSAPYQVSEGTVPGMLAPVFSPDGRHLAWLEFPQGEPQQSARLRTIGWTDDGPGTGRTADDHADFELEAIDTTWPVTLEDWIWDEVAEDGTARGELRAVGPAGLYHIDIERQGDGALAVPPDAVRLGSGGDAAVIDIDDAHAGDEVHGIPSPGPEFQLLAAGDGSQDAEGVRFTLVHQPPGGPTTEWPLPDLGGTSDPWGAWMTADGGGVIVGFGGDAWFVTEDGAEPLPGRVVRADAVS